MQNLLQKLQCKGVSFSLKPCILSIASLLFKNPSVELEGRNKGTREKMRITKKPSPYAALHHGEHSSCSHPICCQCLFVWIIKKFVSGWDTFPRPRPSFNVYLSKHLQLRATFLTGARAVFTSWLGKNQCTVREFLSYFRLLPLRIFTKY